MKFISGLKNCHIPGLYSLVISERQSEMIGMRRVFYASPECRLSEMWDGADFMLKPHNHRQDIILTKLCGSVTNIKVIQSGPDRPYTVYRYGFGSALKDGSFTLTRMWKEDIGFREQPITESPLLMHWSEFHTIIAAPGSSWMVEERQMAPASCERLLSVNHNLSLSAEGLYIPLTESELRHFEDIIPSPKEN